jgi:hypothetical protein
MGPSLTLLIFHREFKSFGRTCLERARRQLKALAFPELLTHMPTGFRDCVINGRLAASEIPEI